jgi:hypothetical protein
MPREYDETEMWWWIDSPPPLPKGENTIAEQENKNTTQPPAPEAQQPVTRRRVGTQTFGLCDEFSRPVLGGTDLMIPAVFRGRGVAVARIMQFMSVRTLQFAARSKYCSKILSANPDLMRVIPNLWKFGIKAMEITPANKEKFWDYMTFQVVFYPSCYAKADVTEYIKLKLDEGSFNPPLKDCDGTERRPGVVRLTDAPSLGDEASLTYRTRRGKRPGSGSPDLVVYPEINIASLICEYDGKWQLVWPKGADVARGLYLLLKGTLPSDDELMKIGKSALTMRLFSDLRKRIQSNFATVCNATTSGRHPDYLRVAQRFKREIAEMSVIADRKRAEYRAALAKRDRKLAERDRELAALDPSYVVTTFTPESIIGETPDPKMAGESKRGEPDVDDAFADF